MNQFLTSPARTLREEMDNARTAFSKAHADYLRAMAIAMDREANADDAVALRREGRAYAQALTRYSEATMAWLVFVETHVCAMKQAARAQASSD